MLSGCFGGYRRGHLHHVHCRSSHSDPSTVYQTDIQALAYTTISLVSVGRLTIDRERARAHGRAFEALRTLEKRGQPIPPHVLQNIDRWAERRWFSVPTDRGRVVLPTLPHEQAYDLGDTNWRLLMGQGWGWLLPWKALRRGLGKQDMLVWPLNPVVEKRLRDEASRRSS